MKNILVILTSESLNYLDLLDTTFSNQSKLYVIVLGSHINIKNKRIIIISENDKDILVKNDIDIIVINTNFNEKIKNDIILMINEYNYVKVIHCFSDILVNVKVPNEYLIYYNTCKLPKIKSILFEEQEKKEKSFVLTIPTIPNIPTIPTIPNISTNPTPKKSDSIERKILTDFDKFSEICLRLLKSVKNENAKEISKNGLKETVFIEFRILPHTEQIIRNCINKLDATWSHTVVCGNDNYNFCVKICNKINVNIKIIKLDVSNFNQNKYNNLLLTKDFWNLFNGEKLLIYQSDSYIFKSNIDDFLDYDYVGSPFYNSRKIVLAQEQVGNGGLSLRSKTKMLEVLDKVKLDLKDYSKFICSYRRAARLDFIPEDVYFSQNMQNHNIGIVAPYNISLQFSTNTVYSEDCFGMHAIWRCCKDWENEIMKRVNNEDEDNNKQDDKEYLNKIVEFCKITGTTQENVLRKPKQEFRYFCYRYSDYIKNIDLPIITYNNYYEAVLIEYRYLPHLEFLIRNCIDKLGVKWSQTIICGNLNYDYMINIVNSINRNIKVIKTNYDNLMPSDYSLFLSSKDFWNLCVGEKILIYQEDACIFKNNIDEFIEWDYIGAPWLKTQNDTTNCVGNGGLSLRSKSCMINVIDIININDTSYNSSTIEYMKNTNSTCPPEDVYFSKNMQELNIGKVADWDSAYAFSSESYLNTNSFGGHGVWVNGRIINNTIDRSLWKKHMYNVLKNYCNPQIIPLNIYLTWSSKILPPKMKKNVENLKRQNPEFNILLYDDDDVLNFLIENFDDDVVNSYNALIPGAYKADLFRLCILYKLGGIYIDIKYSCVNNFKLINLIDGSNYYVKDRAEMGCCGIYNGFMVFKKNTNELLLAINQIVSNVKNRYYGNSCLEITGPDLLIKYFNRDETILRFNQINGIDIIYKNNVEILKSYESYRYESKMYSKKEHYGILWKNRNVYDITICSN